MENKLKDIIIIGAGDLGKDVAWLIERINDKHPTYNILGFTDVSEEKSFQGYPVLGNDNVINDYENIYVICALADSKKRLMIMNNLPDNVKAATLIDPLALVHKTSVIEQGSMVFANSIVGINAHIGKNCVVLYNAAVNHDAVLQDGVTIYPNATISGKCQIGKCCQIGTGASLIQGIKVCDDATIGVGAAVFTNVNKSGTTYGNPAVTMGAKKQ